MNVLERCIEGLQILNVVDKGGSELRAVDSDSRGFIIVEVVNSIAKDLSSAQRRRLKVLGWKWNGELPQWDFEID